MVRRSMWSAAGLGVVLAWNSTVSATTVPFTEVYSSGVSGWTDNGGVALTAIGSGGPDGSSYASGTFNFTGTATGDNPALLRGHGSNDASGDAFVGNWITDGVTMFSAQVRHDAGVPLTFFARFASPANFPGAVAIDFTPVPSGVWTQIDFAISSSSPQFVSFEGNDFNTVFSNIGNVQIGISVPAALADQDQTVTFDVDNVSIVPEPASLGLAALGCCAVMWRRGRRG